MPVSPCHSVDISVWCTRVGGTLKPSFPVLLGLLEGSSDSLHGLAHYFLKMTEYFYFGSEQLCVVCDQMNADLHASSKSVAHGTKLWAAPVWSVHPHLLGKAMAALK